jgi:hypothetical protein
MLELFNYLNNITNTALDQAEANLAQAIKTLNNIGGGE